LSIPSPWLLFDRLQLPLCDSRCLTFVLDTEWHVHHSSVLGPRLEVQTLVVKEHAWPERLENASLVDSSEEEGFVQVARSTA
jgi:hypothetical protein